MSSGPGGGGENFARSPESRDGAGWGLERWSGGEGASDREKLLHSFAEKGVPVFVSSGRRPRGACARALHTRTDCWLQTTLSRQACYGPAIH
ncbi:hypothetical protein [Leptospirillum ferriphilum]|uniref:Uncharacterized protein n=1 Tax=Leptospirillum ferriphilum TaxID=178606 RepID=A0A1V3SUM0_9BACT|nr:hypothetical protein [Leptospirillum ferriphilum]OOH72170.1 hypothetical protein BOX24_07195 [Leptospirillum ferriphilum]